MGRAPNRRILLIDDMPAIHEDFRKILLPIRPLRPDLAALGAALFGDGGAGAVNNEAQAEAPFEIASAFQGRQGLALATEALAQQRPFALAFVDMRMPPGWDGVETIERLWQLDPQLQVVICTAYADMSWPQVLARLDARDRLLVLKKPFDAIEVSQLARALTAKWEMARQAAARHGVLEREVAQRTAEIGSAQASLQARIDERDALENQLLQAEKLAALGQLTAGVAHEINNPIGYVESNFATLARYVGDLLALLDAYHEAEAALPPDGAARLAALRAGIELDYLKQDIPALLEQSRSGIARVRQIVLDLKDFSRASQAEPWQRSNLHHGIDATLNIVGSELRYKADVVKQYGDLPEIECQAAHLNQAIMNVLVNAAQAMGSARGTITISTGCEADGAHVWLEIADTGAGIAPDVLPRIFDPFFTTKPIGQGTGLGLSIAYGVVQRHGGSIVAHSAVSTGGGVAGTVFRIVLPVRQPQSPQPHA